MWFKLLDWIIIVIFLIISLAFHKTISQTCGRVHVRCRAKYSYVTGSRSIGEPVSNQWKILRVWVCSGHWVLINSMWHELLLFFIWPSRGGNWRPNWNCFFVKIMWSYHLQSKYRLKWCMMFGNENFCGKSPGQIVRIEDHPHLRISRHWHATNSLEQKKKKENRRNGTTGRHFFYSCALKHSYLITQEPFF